MNGDFRTGKGRGGKGWRGAEGQDVLCPNSDPNTSTTPDIIFRLNRRESPSVTACFYYVVSDKEMKELSNGFSYLTYFI